MNARDSRPGKGWLIVVVLVMAMVPLLLVGRGWAQEPVGEPQGTQWINGAEVPVAPADVAAPADHGRLADGFLYALLSDGGGNEIYGFRADGSTGSLSLLPGFPEDTLGSGDGLTVSERLFYDRAGGRLFAINSGSNTLSAYKVNLTTGGLSKLPYHNTNLGASGSGWNCLTVHPSGSPLVVGNTSGSEVRSYTVTDAKLTQAPGSPYASDTFAFSCTFSKDGRYVYFGANNIYGYSVDSASGQLTPLRNSPYAFGSLPIANAVDDAGRFFLANNNVGQLRAATIDGGPLTGVNDNPFSSALADAVHGLVHPAGFYMVADRGANQVGVYAIGGSGSGTTLKAVAGSPFSTGASGSSDTHILALHEGGHFLYAANAATRNITRLSVNQSTGALSNLGSTAANSVGDSGRITGLAFAPIPDTWPRVLVFDSNIQRGVGSFLPELALARLEFPYTLVGGDETAFLNKLNSGRWDIVLFECNNCAMQAATRDALTSFMNQGGRAIVYSWTVEFSPADPLWAALGADFVASITSDGSPLVHPIYHWDKAHPVFTYPEDVPDPFHMYEANVGIGAQRVEPLPGFTALAGYTASPAADQAALIEGNHGRTLFKAFSDAFLPPPPAQLQEGGDFDRDSDNVVDGVEIWTDMIRHIARSEVTLPVVLKNVCMVRMDGREAEPNENRGQASQICLSTPVKGNPNNTYPKAEFDWYSFEWNGLGTLQVDLTNFVTDGQLILYKGTSELGKDFNNTTLQVIHPGAGPGTYYVLVTAGVSRPDPGSDYTLTVTAK